MRHHPETRARCRRSEHGAAILIGNAFATSPGTVDAALDRILAAESTAAELDALDELSGRFALLSLTDRGKRVFTDPIGSRSLYYRIGSSLCIASHAELIGRAFGHPQSPAVERILSSEEYRSRTVKYLPGDLAYYEGVHALVPNNYYDLSSGRTVRYWPRRQRAATSFDDFFKALDAHLTALAAYLEGLYEPILGVTGGIDTRTIIAAFHHRGLRFRGVTWHGVGGAYLEQGERGLLEALAERAGAEHSYLELGPLSRELRRVSVAARRNAGGHGRRSRLAAQMQRRFGRRDAAFIRGYGAEIIRGFYNFDRRSRRPPTARALPAWMRRVPPLERRTRGGPIARATPSELSRAYDSSTRRARVSREHVRLLGDAFAGFIERANYDDERLLGYGFDLNDVFYWEHRMGIWGAAKHNEMDAALLSIAGFNSRSVYEAAFGLEARERLTKELLLRVVRRYDQPMAEIPYA